MSRPFLCILQYCPVSYVSSSLHISVHDVLWSLLQAREELSLTHFSYSEWPVSGEDAEGGLVPSATHGILGLVEHALAHQEEASLTGPIAVHCRSVHYTQTISVVSAVYLVIMGLYHNPQAGTFNLPRSIVVKACINSLKS